MNTIPRVLVVDDDSFMRALIERVFVDAHMPVTTFASGRELLAAGDLNTPAVLLLDVRMPDMSGLELQALLRERGVGLPVVFLTGNADIPTAVAAMRNGAFDFVEKPFDKDDLVARICRAAQAAALAARREQARPELARRLGTLTTREREVYDRMVVGMTSKAIANELGGSFRTIEIHRGRVMGKMGAANISDLVRMAFEADETTDTGGPSEP